MQRSKWFKIKINVITNSKQEKWVGSYDAFKGRFEFISEEGLSQEEFETKLKRRLRWKNCWQLPDDQ